MRLSRTKLSWRSLRTPSSKSHLLCTTLVSLYTRSLILPCFIEAGYALRKHIIDKAKAHPIWSKDLKEVNVGEVLAVTAKKSRATEQLFEEQLATYNYNQGEMYLDTNLRIIYKTFLKPNDPRLISPLENRQ